MIKIFLVEDESIVREGLRDNIPWEQYGFQFVGEASDGEMALPLIRKQKPDVLITDIKMPFMDGLALSRIVGQEFPNMKVIIISGYDEFEYAREAIQVGVEQYLLKPITKSTLQKTLAQVKEKIENEQEQKDYMEKFQNEMHEYEQFSRRTFFEKVFEGRYSVQQIYEEAQKLSMEINASSYNLVMVSLQDHKKKPGEQSTDSEMFITVQEELLRFFLRFSEYLVFRWNVSTYGILIKGEPDQMEDLTNRCVDNGKRICSSAEHFTNWYITVGEPVERLSLLPECYTKMNHIMSFRYFHPEQHILTQNMIQEVSPKEDDGNIGNLDIAKVNPDIITGFLDIGQQEEIENFVNGFLEGIKEALKSKMFRDYLMLSIRFTTIAYIESLGSSQEEFAKEMGDGIQETVNTYEELMIYAQKVLETAIRIRNRESRNQGKKILKTALSYIEENYTQESLSLNTVAAITEVSATYFSAIFSQEMDMTFTEYVTQKRMDKAKKLLKQTEKHSGEIALEIGYKDPHYFSFVFKKTQGCTPREYRASQQNN